MALAGIISTHWVLCRERGRDRHGDMLGVCHIAGFRGPDINAHLAAEGWALADRRRSRDYVDEEAWARAEGRDIWAPWVRAVFGAAFDRDTERYISDAGLELLERRFLVSDVIRLLVLRPKP